MKGLKLILTACLVPLAFQGAAAEDAGDAARAATRRGTSTTVVSSRQKSSTTPATPTAAVSRTTNSLATQTAQSTQSVRERTTTTSPRTGTVVINSENRGDTANSTQSVSARTTSNVQSRATTTGAAVSTSAARTAARTAVSTAARTAAGQSSSASHTSATARSATTPSRATTTARTATTGNRISRSALTREEVMTNTYTNCRDIYYSCMDEFCANKDTQLKRCACSSRVNEFDSVKKQLSNVEEKMLDFNQRLLTVNMDKEDAEALYKATEGELAFSQADTSDSKKLLDEIANKLNTSFDSSNFDTSLSALSWSLNADAAFDNVDSLMGASTTSKTGTALYSAALPVCREMALEVCTEDELELAVSGYQMSIEQDCNTVAKSYQTQTDQAREKIREGSALLDMSRLDIYQKRNSDDILTCKKKMLTMLTDSTVCGTNLSKCLDTSGRYIDPSTGEAFLTVELANLGNLITRPTSDQTWTSAPGNEVFVSFLNSKKKFLEPAMENCQDIADNVWDAFIEDALAQIKLAQESKLEEMRQSCTTLTTQCLADTAESLADFDARALSTFGVAADKTVNAMCSDVRTACTALLETTGGDTDWVSGMTEIATDTTYDTIIQTCREVGRACIIQACKSISGNFGLCENIQTSVNRKAIVNRTSCWSEVVQCVASAGEDSINNIFQQLNTRGEVDKYGAFYSSLYGTSPVAVEITNPDTSDTAAGISSLAQTDDDESDEDQTTETTQSCHKRKMTDDNGNVQNMNCVYDLCESECGCGYNNGTYECSSLSAYNCKVCRLAEKIWGNCEVLPTTLLSTSGSHNRIRIPTDSTTGTLLSWFATNTGTQNTDDSCRDTSCGIGYVAIESQGIITCVSKELLTSDKGDNTYCPVPPNTQIDIGTYSDNTGTENVTNCCLSPNATDSFGNCCAAGTTTGEQRFIAGNVVALQNRFGTLPTIASTSQNICLPADTKHKFVATFTQPNSDYYTGATNYYLICVGDDATTGQDATSAFPNGQTVSCNGRYILVLQKGNSLWYIAPNYNAQAAMDNGGTPQMTVVVSENYKYTWDTDKKTWEWKNGDKTLETINPTHWSVSYK